MSKFWGKRTSQLQSANSGVANIDRAEQQATWYYDQRGGDKYSLHGELNLEQEEGKWDRVEVTLQNGILAWLRISTRQSRNTVRPAIALQDAKVNDVSSSGPQSTDTQNPAATQYSFEVLLSSGKRLLFHSDGLSDQQYWLQALMDNSLYYWRERVEDLSKKLEKSEATLKETRISLQSLTREANDQKAMFHARKASIEHERVMVEERWEATKQKEKLYEEAYRESEAKQEKLKDSLAEQEYQFKQQLAETKRKWTDNIRQIQEESENKIQQLALESKEFQYRVEQAQEEIQGLRTKNSRLEEEVQKSSAEVMAARSKLNLRENSAGAERKEAQQTISQLKEKIHALERETRELEAKSSSTERMLMRVEQTRDALERELERRKSQLVTLQQRERDAQKQAANLAGQLEVQREEQRRYTQSLKESVQEKDKQILDLHRRNGELEAHYELIKMELVSRDRLSRQNSDMTVEKMMELERQLNLAHQKIYELDEVNRGLNQKWESSTAEIRHENTHLKAKVKELENFIKSSKDHLQQTDQQVNQLQQELVERDGEIERLRQNIAENEDIHRQEIQQLHNDIDLQHTEADAQIEAMKKQMEMDRQLLQQEAENMLRENGDAQLSMFADLLLDIISLAGYDQYSSFTGLTKHELYEEGAIIDFMESVARELIAEREEGRKELQRLEYLLQQEREKSKKIQHDAMLTIQSLQGFINPDMMMQSANPNLKQSIRRAASDRNLVREQQVPRPKSRSRLSTPDMIMEEDMDQKSKSLGSSTSRAEQVYTQTNPQLPASHQLPPLGPPNQMPQSSGGQQTPKKSPSRKSHKKQLSQELSYGRAPTPTGQPEEQQVGGATMQQQINTVQALIQAASILNRQQTERRKSPMKKRSSDKKRHSPEAGVISSKQHSSKNKSASPPKQVQSNKAQVGVGFATDTEHNEVVSPAGSKENLSELSNSNQIRILQAESKSPVQEEKSVESPAYLKDGHSGEHMSVEYPDKGTFETVAKKSHKKDSKKERKVKEKHIALENQASSNLDQSNQEQSASKPQPVTAQRMQSQASINQIMEEPKPKEEQPSAINSEKAEQQVPVTKVEGAKAAEEVVVQRSASSGEQKLGKSSSVADKIGKFGSMIKQTSSSSNSALSNNPSIKGSFRPKRDVSQRLAKSPSQPGSVEDEIQKNTNLIRDLKVKLKQVQRRFKETELSEEDIQKLKDEEDAINNEIEAAKEAVKQARSKLESAVEQETQS